MKFKLRVAVISASSAFDGKKIVFSGNGKRDASAMQQQSGPFIHRQFLLLVPVESRLADLKPLVLQHYNKLYGPEPSFVPLRRVCKFRDELQCDLDDDFQVVEVCENGAAVYALCDLDFHNAKKPKTLPNNHVPAGPAKPKPAPVVPSFKTEQQQQQLQQKKDQAAKKEEPKPTNTAGTPKKNPKKEREASGSTGQRTETETASATEESKPAAAVEAKKKESLTAADRANPGGSGSVEPSVPAESKSTKQNTSNVAASAAAKEKPVEPFGVEAPAVSEVTSNAEPLVIAPVTPSPSPAPASASAFIPRKSPSLVSAPSSSEDEDDSCSTGAITEHSMFGFELPSIVVSQPKRSEVSILFAADTSSDSEAEDGGSGLVTVPSSSSSVAEPCTARKNSSPVPDPLVMPSLAEVVDSVSRAPTPGQKQAGKRGRPRKKPAETVSVVAAAAAETVATSASAAPAPVTAVAVPTPTTVKTAESAII